MSKEKQKTPSGVRRKYRVRFNKLSDVKRYIGRIINDFDNGLIDATQAKTLFYGCSILSQIMSRSDLEDKVESLERALKIQGESAK